MRHIELLSLAQEERAPRLISSSWVPTSAITPSVGAARTRLDRQVFYRIEP